MSAVSFQISRSDPACSFSTESFEDQTAAYNLQILFNRVRPGVLYRVDEAGKLQHVRGLCAHARYYWNRDSEQAKVKQAVSDALFHYNRFLSRKEVDETDRIAAQTLRRRLEPLSTRVFNRRLFSIQNTLSRITFPEGVIRVKVGQDYIDYQVRDVETRDVPFIEFNLGNDQDNKNLAMLLQRKKRERFRVDAEGNLKRVTNPVSYHFEKAAQEERVSAVAVDVLRKLNHHLEQVVVTRSHKVAITHIFGQSPLTRIKRQAYNRGAVAENSLVESILLEAFGSDLVQRRADLVDHLSTFPHQVRAGHRKEAIKSLETVFMDLVLSEFRFNQKLGVDLERNKDGGSGGARYARSRFGKKLLVVKPGDEGPHGVNNPQRYAWFKRIFVSPRYCLEGNSEPQAEVDSYLFDRRLGIYVVPPTELRYIASREFNGPRKYKECSIQMFVSDCQTLGEYVGVSPRMHSLPRPFLRWYCRTEANRQKIPQEAASNIALHNVGIEDIDCHFENILVRTRDSSNGPSLLDRLFRGESVAQAEIETFVNSFFTEGHNQALIEAILSSYPVTAEGRTQHVTLIKHDGGSSNPRRHPNSYLAKRFKHLFEVLPQYDQQVDPNSRALFRDKQQDFVEFLLEKGARSLRNIHAPEVFREYWNNPDYRQRFKAWLLETNPIEERAKRNLVCNDLIEANSVDSRRLDAYSFYFQYHLERIHENTMTRVDSWKVVQKYLCTRARRQPPMRRLLHVRSGRDFVQELSANDSDASSSFENIETHLASVKARPVSSGCSSLQEDYFKGSSVLDDLGEGVHAQG
ncbi:MAG: hypothetical protein S4CHLAM2_15300 [Chlamydiales bacterium]|nr:hypothetical protein [Chlamydiales bacterium]